MENTGNIKNNSSPAGPDIPDAVQGNKADSVKTLKFILLALFIVLFLAAAAAAGLKFISHEHELNSRIAEINNSINGIEDAMTVKPVKNREAADASFVDAVNDAIAAEYCLNGYQKAACGQDVSFLVVGDSITYSTWPDDVAAWLGFNYGIECELRNMSMPSNTSYAGYVTVNRLEADEQYDFVMVCYGQNDEPEDFELYYEALLRAVLEKNPNCSVICVLESSQREYTEKIQTIQALAEYYKLQTADAIFTFDHSGRTYMELLYDGVHPNVYGNELYVQCVTEVIAGQVEKAMEEKSRLAASAVSGNASGGTGPAAVGSVSGFSRTVREMPSALDGRAYEFESCTFIPAGNFSKDGECSLTIDLGKPLYGKAGIDRIWVPGMNDVKIYYDDVLVYELSQESDLTFELEYTDFLDISLSGSADAGAAADSVENLSESQADIENTSASSSGGRIRIEFGSAEQRDRFIGLAVSSSAK